MRYQVEDPLVWPVAVPRSEWREYGRFSYQSGHTKKPITFAMARDRLLEQLERLGADHVVISTDVPVYADGSGKMLARAGNPDDPGAAAYFQMDGQQRVIAIDRYDDVAQNLAAIAKTIDALRGIERWGGARIMQTAFAGFKALPESTSGTSWWDVLELDAAASPDDIRKAYRRLAKVRHPDKPDGDDAAFAELSNAMRQGLAAREGTVY